ncbi:hypothetical protein KUTeg_013935 [Tegillarca granosa]|uniref:FERM domain-containing protein n=1 Tax=Tegillarca granosa TaxID=220873 RepID=A0ABQ9EXL8_TEGGR|nr:hypothetical protein KUTeg_013935 [Tegillarca granosa]
MPRDIRTSIRVEDIVVAHKSVLDLTPNQAILAFIELLKKWDLFGSTVFEVSNYVASYDFREVLHSSPSINSIMIVVGHVAKGNKYMFHTNQVCQSCITKSY